MNPTEGNAVSYSKQDYKSRAFENKVLMKTSEAGGTDKGRVRILPNKKLQFSQVAKPHGRETKRP
jgi:hypothetical protein